MDRLSEWLGNPIYAGILLVVMIVLIFYLSVAGHWEGSGFNKSIIRFGIYTSVVVGGILCLHNNKVESDMRAKYGNYESEALHAATVGDAVGDAAEPKLGGNDEAGAATGDLASGLKPTCVVYGNMPKGLPGMKLAQPAVAVSPAYTGMGMPAPQYAQM